MDLLSGLSVPWWMAGGRAIDLFAGYETRVHGDTDVLIRRDDQLAVQRYLSDWDLHKTKQPGLKPWPGGEFLARPVNDIWCRRTPDSPWQLQLMLLDTEGDEWIFKRDPAIRGRIEDLGRRTPGGVPYLAPEVQLLYKAKAETIAKDQADFETALPMMDERACGWLLACLEKRFPDGHAWMDALEKRME
ncbi:MAG: amino acid transporter [Anaerolineae bacterium]|nr:amino acid transporter [Anaerolineae bacterium]